MNLKRYKELDRSEKANVLTHFIGVVGSLLATVFMIARPEVWLDSLKTTASLVFGISLFLLYSASTLYHLAVSKSKKALFKVIDHCAIFVLIAGTYTPFALVALKGPVGNQLLWIIWGIALLGIGYKIYLTGKFKILSTIIYLAMGWVAAFYVVPISKNLSQQGLIWLIAGGLCYSGGVIFYLRKRIFSHATWHLFVIGGSFCHFVSIFYYVLPM